MRIRRIFQAMDVALAPRAVARRRNTFAVVAGAAGLSFLALSSADAQSATRSPGGARDDLTDRQVVLVTGSTSGLGREVALQLAETGAHVIVHGRNRERGEAVVAEIERAGIGSARFYPADLASLGEVRSFAETIMRDYDHLDVLINNAGIGSSSEERQLSADGYELRFAVNYLAGFLLTRTLLPLIRESAPSRIINVSSLAQTPLDFDDLMLEQGYTGSRAYGQSKLAQVLLTFDLARELEGAGVIVNALHPATYMDTNMVRRAGVEPRSTVEEGAAAVMNLVAAPAAWSGQFFNGMEPARANAQAYDADARARLREISYELTGAPRP